jgi:hypothetical protein
VKPPLHREARTMALARRSVAQSEVQNCARCAGLHNASPRAPRANPPPSRLDGRRPRWVARHPPCSWSYPTDTRRRHDHQQPHAEGRHLRASQPRPRGQGGLLHRGDSPHRDDLGGRRGPARRDGAARGVPGQARRRRCSRSSWNGTSPA